MLFLRFLPIIFVTLLFAAHIMRFNGLVWATAVLLLFLLLFIKKPWVWYAWQIIIAIMIIEWIRTTIGFVQFRIITNMPYTRLLIIMLAVIGFNIFTFFWIRKKTKKIYISASHQKSNT